MDNVPQNTPLQHKKHSAARPRQYWLPVGLMGLGVLVLVGLLFMALTQNNEQTVTPPRVGVPPRVGAPLRDFTLPDITGQKTRLSDYEGQVVLVNSWATWCPPCRAEMPDLNAYYQAHKDEGFVVLAVNGGDSQAEAAEFAASNNLAFPVLLDTDLVVLDGFGIQNYPTSIIIGRDGLVKKIQIGLYEPEKLEADVTPLLEQ